MYLSGLGSIENAEFTATGSTVRAKTTSARNWFLKLQRVLNRFRVVAKFGALTVDGVLGPNTTSALKKTASYVLSRISGTSGLASIQSAVNAGVAKDYANIADELAGILDGVANSLALPTLPASSSGAAPKPVEYPSAVTASSAATPYIPEVPMVMEPSSPLMSGLPLIGGLGILAYFLLNKKGAKGRKRGKIRGRKRSRSRSRRGRRR